MTTLNPSHNPFRQSSGRHAQAVHRPSPEPSETGPSSTRESKTFPDQLPTSSDDDDDDDDDDEAGGDSNRSDLGVDGDYGKRNAKRQGRKRVKAVVPALPDLRIEQVCLFNYF